MLRNRLATTGASLNPAATTRCWAELKAMLFGGLHRMGWYHSRPDVSRNAPFYFKWERTGLCLFCLSVLALSLATGFAGELPSPATNPPSARVVSVYDPAAIDAFLARPGVVRAMLDRAITNFTHKETVS